MFGLLVRVRIRSAINTIALTFRQKPALATALTALGCTLFVLFGSLFYGYLSVATRLNATAPVVFELSRLLFLFLFAGAVPFVAGTLLQADDYAVLFTAPVPPRTVVATRIVEAVITNSAQFAVIGLPAFIAIALVLRISPVLIPAYVATILAFLAFPVMVTTALMFIALSIFGYRRIQASVSVVNLLLALTVCFALVLRAGHLPFRASAPLSLPTLLAAATRGAPTQISLDPSTWFAFIICGLGHGGARVAGLLMLAGTLLLTLVLGWACAAAGSRLISPDLLAEPAGDAGGWNAPMRRPGHRAGVMRAVARKDWRTILRDPIVLSQLALPLLLVIVPYVVGTPPGVPSSSADIGGFAVAIAAVVLFMQTSVVGLSSLGIEGRAFWVPMTAPVRLSRYLAAKLSFTFVLTGTTALALLLVSGVSFGVRPTVVAVEAVVGLLVAVGLSGTAVGITAAFPRFAYENPAHRVSVWALILGFMASSTYTVLLGLGGVGAWIWWLRSTADGRTDPVFICAAAWCLTVTAGFVVISMSAGIERLRTLEWEH